MGGFEDSCPKTQARNLAPACAILFQFKRFQILVHDLLFFLSLEARIYRKRMKMESQGQKFMPKFWDRISKTGHSDSVTYPFILHSTPKQL